MLINTKIYKGFLDERTKKTVDYVGVVKSYDKSADLYHVTYSDGDFEELSEKDLYYYMVRYQEYTIVQTTKTIQKLTANVVAISTTSYTNSFPVKKRITV